MKTTSQVGWKHLADDVKMHGAESPVTALVWHLKDGEDPDDYYSSVPYEKVCKTFFSFYFIYFLIFHISIQ